LFGLKCEPLWQNDLILPRAAWRKPWVIHCTA
jgi:hypothetical protein